MEELIEDNIDILEDYFINLGEYGGTAIYKDNCEDMFERWLEDIDEEYILKIINNNK